jgi:propanol-preferring alcohol dehydrogenase
MERFPTPWPGGGASASRSRSDVSAPNYADELFQERQLRSVTADTGADGEAFLRMAARFGVRATTTAYPMAEGTGRSPISRTAGSAAAAVLRN